MTVLLDEELQARRKCIQDVIIQQVQGLDDMISHVFGKVVGMTTELSDSWGQVIGSIRSVLCCCL